MIERHEDAVEDFN